MSVVATLPRPAPRCRPRDPCCRLLCYANTVSLRRSWSFQLVSQNLLVHRAWLHLTMSSGRTLVTALRASGTRTVPIAAQKHPPLEAESAGTGLVTRRRVLAAVPPACGCAVSSAARAEEAGRNAALDQMFAAAMATGEASITERGSVYCSSVGCPCRHTCTITSPGVPWLLLHAGHHGVH